MVNLKKTKVMVSGSKDGECTIKVDPLAKCRKGVMKKSLMCTKWSKWVRGRCAKTKKVVLILAKGFAYEHIETMKGIVKPGKENIVFLSRPR